MNTRTALWHDIHPARRWALVWPREHGGWGILFVALLTGIAVGTPLGANLQGEIWLLAAASALFCARTPIENALFPGSPFRPRSTSELRWMAFVAATFSAIAGVAVAMLFGGPLPPGLFAVILLAAGIFVVQNALKMAGRHTRIVTQLTGAVGLTATAAMAYSVAAGRMDRVALILWAANGLFAINQILYVQLRVQQVKAANHKRALVNKRVFVGSEFLTATCLTFWWQIGWIPGAVLLAFVPALMRGAIWCLLPGNRSLDIRRLGKKELANGLAFAGLLFIAFRVSL